MSMPMSITLSIDIWVYNICIYVICMDVLLGYTEFSNTSWTEYPLSRTIHNNERWTDRRPDNPAGDQIISGPALIHCWQSSVKCGSGFSGFKVKLFLKWKLYNPIYFTQHLHFGGNVIALSFFFSNSLSLSSFFLCFTCVLAIFLLSCYLLKGFFLYIL